MRTLSASDRASPDHKYTVISYKYGGKEVDGRWGHHTLKSVQEQVGGLNMSMDTVDAPLHRIVVKEKGKRKPIYSQECEYGKWRP